MLDPHFVILGSLINLMGSSIYILRTLQGKTRPNRVTFFMWTLAPMLAFGGEIQKGVGLTALMTFTTGFVPLLIFLASFVDKKAIWKLTAFDFYCGFMSAIGLIFWLLSKEGNLAIGFSILADGLASLPTLRKSYTNPESETWQGYFATILSASITLLTIHRWNIANFGFPVYILLINIMLTYLIAIRPLLSQAKV